MKKRLFFTIGLATLLLATLIPCVPIPVQVSAASEYTNWVIKFNPSGTQVKNGVLLIRLDIYPPTTAKTFNEQYVDHLDREPTQEELDDPVKVALIPKHKELNPALCHFVAVPENVDKAWLESYIAQWFDKDTMATFDDILVQPNSAHLVSAFTRTRKPAQVSSIQTRNLADLILSTNEKLKGLGFDFAGGDKASKVETHSITIGTVPIDRNSYNNTRTIVEKSNPANATGTITSVQIWAVLTMTNTEAATFYVVSGNNLSTRDTVAIGSVTSGSLQTFDISGTPLDVVTGDYIGTYFSDGQIESTWSGGTGIWYILGDYIPCTNQAFTYGNTYIVSLYGTGTEAGGAVAPTITISAASGVEATTATLNGNVTVTGGENPTVTVYWGDNDGEQVAGNWDHSSAPNSPSQPQGVAAFYLNVNSLPTGTNIYFSAKATNSGGTGWPAASLSFLTKPAAPTNIDATNGTETSKVVVTWTKSTGASNYVVWRDSTNASGTLGDVDIYDDAGAAAPTIIPGTASATDGNSASFVTLSISGESANNGTTYSYKVVASNATGNSSDSSPDNGYRGTTTLTYQWQRSDADSDADYNTNLGTTNPYDDSTAPAPTIISGTASATDGNSASFVTLSVSGESANIGAKRYFRCVVSMTGATSQNSTGDEGWRGVGSLTRQWYRSAANSNENYSILEDATFEPYNDTTAPVPVITPGTASASDGTYTNKITLSIAGESSSGEGRYYKCYFSATGATSQYSTADSGYRSAGSLSYQWYRSSGDLDSDLSILVGAITDPCDDTTTLIARYYYCLLSASGIENAETNHDRGYISLLIGMFASIISDYEVDIIWSLPEGAEKTMVRAAIGRTPADRNDGWLVYYDTSENAQDWHDHLGLIEGLIYYKAWYQDNEGNWLEDVAETSIEGGQGMTEIANSINSLSSSLNSILSFISALWSSVWPYALVMLLSLILGGLAYWHRDRWLYILSGFAFLFCGGYFFTIHSVGIYPGILFMLLGMYGFFKAAWERKQKA
jgi:hypothetical protein